jgi:molybdopterin converting factor small subunit
LRIRFYGRLADAIAPEIDVAGVAGCSVGEVRERIASDFASAAEPMARSRAFIADSFVTDDTLVADGERLEFLPPVSGG